MYPQEYETHNILRTPSRVADVKAASYRVPSRAAEGLGVNNDRIQAYAHWRNPGQIYSTPSTTTRNPAGGGTAYGVTAAPTSDVVTRFEQASAQIWSQANPTYPVERVVKDHRPWMHETPMYHAKFPLGYTQGRRCT